MHSFNLLLKKIKKKLLSINRLIEDYFNSFKKIELLKLKIQKKLKIIDNRVFLGVGILTITVLFYFLIPNFYNKEKLNALIEKKIYDTYALDVKFNKKISYSFFPKPHFVTKNLSVKYKDDEIAKVSNSKIYISFNNFFKKEDLLIKNLDFNKAEFMMNSRKISFFKEILNSNNTPYKISIRNSKLFYQDKDEDVIFISKIKKIIYLFDELNSENKMISNFEIFNLPFNFKVSNNKSAGILLTYLKSKKIKLNVENKLDFNKSDIIGSTNIKIMSKYEDFNYEIKKDSLSFLSADNDYKGLIEFKPFYFFSELKFHQINLKSLFERNSLLINFINSEISTNQNLNMNINLNIDKIYNDPNLKNFYLKTFLEEGNFFIRDSVISWKDEIKIKINEIQIDSSDSNLKIFGSSTLDFAKTNSFYSYFQVKKKHRKNIKLIQYDFVYDLNLKKLTLDNIKIDQKSNINIISFINNYNLKNANFNKVTFRNFVKDFFSTYAG